MTIKELIDILQKVKGENTPVYMGNHIDGFYPVENEDDASFAHDLNIFYITGNK